MILFKDRSAERVFNPFARFSEVGKSGLTRSGTGLWGLSERDGRDKYPVRRLEKR
jgi:hypothetical protein